MASTARHKRNSCEETGKDPSEAVSEDHVQDLGARRADSHPDANLGRAPRDGVREDTVDATGGEDKRDNGEQCGKERGETALGAGAIDEELHGLDMRGRVCLC